MSTAPPARCRLCTANDLDGLAEELAGRLWELRRDPEHDPAWADAGPYWQRVFHQFAGEAVEMLGACAHEPGRLAA